MTGHHPGRLACLTRAAYDPDVTPMERGRLLRYGAPGWDTEQALAVLKQAKDAREAYDRPQAERLITSLLTPPEPTGETHA